MLWTSAQPVPRARERTIRRQSAVSRRAMTGQVQEPRQSKDFRLSTG